MEASGAPDRAAPSDVREGIARWPGAGCAAGTEGTEEIGWAGEEGTFEIGSAGAEGAGGIGSAGADSGRGGWAGCPGGVPGCDCRRARRLAGCPTVSAVRDSGTCFVIVAANLRE
ncbi:hypothetical protein AHIS1636_21470 [Arthrobacter mangrovi]|uniref:Uncharacterized protein n=1 Tax=Arthrobacter mangrovi TaxID=2966350 RepID=A0ABQ5MUN6_9MICC|nr:hypothetical protein AHIS1636_21470 [Arthrobacter mangrovi]